MRGRYSWLLLLFITILVPGSMQAGPLPLTPATGLSAEARSVNGRPVTLLPAERPVPGIWSDDQGYRAVDWSENSWRAAAGADGLARGDRLDGTWATSGPFAADINHIQISHASPNVLYAAVACGGEPFLGGVYRSTNGGLAWERLDPDTTFGPVNCIAMNPENHFELFAAAELGLFRSTNGGNSWELVAPVAGSYARSTCVAYNSAGGGELVVHYYCEPSPGSRLFRSTDGGDSFTPIGAGLPDDLPVTDICFDPLEENRIYLALGSDFGDTGFYVSEDSGAQWTDLSGGLDGKPVNSISVTNDGDHCSVLVTTGRNFAHQSGGLFELTYPGGEWTRLAAETIQGAGFLGVCRHEAYPGLILVGSQGLGVLKSADGGTSWVEANDGLTGEVVTCFAPRPDALAVYSGCESMGVFVSQDDGDSWEARSEGINMVKVTDVAVDPLDPRRIVVSFTSLNSGGLFLTTDGGERWSAAPNLVDQRAQAVALGGSGGQVIYAAMEGPVTTEIPEGVYKSTDGGQSWHCTGPDGPAYLNNLLYALEVDEENGVLLTGGRGYISSLPARVFRSTDGGGSWIQVHEGDQYSTVMDFSRAPQGSSVCYAAVDHAGGINGMGGVLRTDSAGASWVEVNNGLNTSARLCRTVSVDPFDADIAFASIFNSGVYRTTDGGGTWQITGFPGGQAHSVICDPLIRGMVYASTGGYAVLCSKDSGTQYQDVGEGYAEDSVYRFGFDNRYWQPRIFACGSQGLYCMELEPLGLPDTLDVCLSCLPESITLPETVNLNLDLTNRCHLTRSYRLSIDVELPSGATYIAYRQGNVVLGPGAVFSTATPVNFNAYGSLVGMTIFSLTGTDITPASANGGWPAGFSDAFDCRVSATLP